MRLLLDCRNVILAIFSGRTLPAHNEDSANHAMSFTAIRRKKIPGRNMIITRILAYRVELPLHEGSYKWSGGKSVSVFDSTVVVVETDVGITGYGEVCPLGPFYLPAY